MRLIGCHIEGYGKLTDTEYDFGEGITEFCEHNGFGKTTLASFIKAMFYGLPAVRNNTAEFNDRMHFYPFGGGKFGGNITFEKDGKQYRIERFFDRKSEKGDTVAVYENGKKTNKFGKDIGRGVFGLDKESFERTTFVTADAIDICATSGISAKLNNFVDNTDAENSFDTAKKRLESAKKKLRAERGDNDLITKKRAEIVELKGEIDNLETMERTLEGYYVELTDLNGQIRALEAKLESANAVNLSVERWARYEYLLARKAECEKQLDAFDIKYPYGLPTADELGDIKSRNQKTIKLGGQKTATADDGNRGKLDELARTFGSGVPDFETMRAVQNDIDEIKRLDTEMSATSRAPRSRFDELSQKFADGSPSASDISDGAEKAERLRTLDDQLKLRMNLVPAEVKPERKSAKPFLIFAAVAAVIALVGIGVLFVSAVAGGILLGLGVVALGADGFVYFKKNSAAAHPFIMSDDIVKLQEERQSLEKQLRELVAEYSCASENGVLFDFATLKKDCAEYAKLTAAADETTERVKQMQAASDALTQKTKAFFAGYGLDGDDLQDMHIRLLNGVTEYMTVHNAVASSDRESESIQNEIKAQCAAVAEILAAYKIPLWDDLSEQIETLDKAATEIARLKTEKDEVGAEADAFKTEHGLTEKPTEERIDTAALTEKLSELRRDAAVIDTRIADTENQVDLLDVKRAALATAEQTLETYISEHAVLTAAVESMIQAEQNLKDAYIAPVRDNFLVYAKAIENALGEKVSMDQDFRILFERNGEYRSDRHLGAGQRSICALCFRLALVDNMYKDEKPFIIMDDPFVHLDADHMEKTMQTVKELARDKQIVYFCCHDSRRIERASN